MTAGPPKLTTAMPSQKRARSTCGTMPSPGRYMLMIIWSNSGWRDRNCGTFSSQGAESMGSSEQKVGTSCPNHASSDGRLHQHASDDSRFHQQNTCEHCALIVNLPPPKRNFTPTSMQSQEQCHGGKTDVHTAFQRVAEGREHSQSCCLLNRGRVAEKEAALTVSFKAWRKGRQPSQYALKRGGQEGSPHNAFWPTDKPARTDSEQLHGTSAAWYECCMVRVLHGTSAAWPARKLPIFHRT
eukprot:158278-Chlamydomonas_euryale.AAC.6